MSQFSIEVSYAGAVQDVLKTKLHTTEIGAGGGVGVGVVSWLVLRVGERVRELSVIWAAKVLDYSRKQTLGNLHYM